MINSLELYINAQKWVSINFIILGVILAIIGLLCIFVFPKSALTIGLKWGAIATAVFILIGGISYYSFNNKVSEQAHTLYQENTQEFVTSEHERMEIVDSGYVKYQIIFAVFLVVSLVVILFVKSEMFKGIAFAVAFLMLGVMLIEAYSHKSITDYTNVLREERKRL